MKALVAAALIGPGLLGSSCGSDNDQPEAQPAGPCRIAFRVQEGDNDDSPSDIVLVNADGTGQRNLTARWNQYEWPPVWSPDGRKIAFTAQTGSGISANDIFVMNADGSGRRQLTSDGADNQTQTWSRDSRTILYTRLEDDGTLSSWAINADGSDKRRFQRFGEGVVPSPDGEHIAGIRNSGVESDYYGSPDVYVAKSNGEDGKWLTRSGDTVIYGWSPDSGWILYNRQPGFEQPGRPGLYVVRPDGSERRRLTHDEASYDASWSPDGRRVLYSSQSSRPGIYVVALDGRPPRRLTRRADDLSASWSREGTRIVFYRVGEIWMMKSDGTHVRPVARPRGVAVYGSPTWSPACK